MPSAISTSTSTPVSATLPHGNLSGPTVAVSFPIPAGTWTAYYVEFIGTSDDATGHQDILNGSAGAMTTGTSYDVSSATQTSGTNLANINTYQGSVWNTNISLGLSVSRGTDIHDTITGIILHLTGTPTCVYSLDPASQSFDANAYTGQTFTVNTSSGCSWAATVDNDPATGSPYSWLHITSGSGTGTGDVTYSVDTNGASGPSANRTGTITAGGQTFTVKQSGCAYSLFPTEAHWDSFSHTTSLQLATGGGCNWTATPNVPWLHLLAGAYGTGEDDSIIVLCDANTGPDRVGTITFTGGQIFTAYQMAPLVLPDPGPVEPTTAPSSGGGGGGRNRCKGTAGITTTSNGTGTPVSVNINAVNPTIAPGTTTTTPGSPGSEMLPPQPEVIPGGALSENRWKDLQQALANINNTVNNLTQSLTISVGQAGGANGSSLNGFVYVGNAVPADNPDLIWGGNRVLLKLKSGYYLAVWEQTSGTTFAIVGMMMSPEGVWMGLDGNQPGPTLIASAMTAGMFSFPAVCEDDSSGIVYVFWIDQTSGHAGQYVTPVQPKGDKTFTVSTPVLVRSGSLTYGGKGDDAYSQGAQRLLYANISSGLANVDYGKINADGTQTWISGYLLTLPTGGSGGTYTPGLSRRIIPLSGQNVLFLAEFHDSGAAAGNNNINAATTIDGGMNWLPYGSLFATPSDACLIENNVSAPNGTITVPGWESAWKVGTNTIGVVYVGSSQGTNKPGIYYAEYTYGANTWTPKSKHVRLSSYDGDIHPILSYCDGFARVMWIHRQGTGAGQVYSLHYRSCSSAEDALTLNNWDTEKEVFSLSTRGANTLTVAEITGLQWGLDAIGNTLYWPILFSREAANSQSVNVPNHEIGIKFFPIVILDS